MLVLIHFVTFMIIQSELIVIGFMAAIIHRAQAESCLSWHMNHNVTASKHMPCSPVNMFVARDTKCGWPEVRFCGSSKITDVIPGEKDMRIDSIR